MSEMTASQESDLSMTLSLIYDERQAQHAKWGEQNHPDGTSVVWLKAADYYRDLCDERHRQGRGSWLDILLEEVYEAAAEEDPERLRRELVQVAAVASAWAEALVRRGDIS